MGDAESKQPELVQTEAAEPVEQTGPEESVGPAEPQAADLTHTRKQPNNPLHGVTLEVMLRYLLANLGWPGLAERIPARCFSENPSMGSSLKFLRKTPWAREKVEGLYLFMLREHARRGRRKPPA